MIQDAILVYLTIGFGLGMYDLYHDPKLGKEMPWWIIIVAQIHLMILWPFYLTKKGD